MPNTTEKHQDRIARELADIKRLLAFAILRSGASQGDVAAALGVNQSQVSRMFPNGLAREGGRGGKKKSQVKR